MITLQGMNEPAQRRARYEQECRMRALAATNWHPIFHALDAKRGGTVAGIAAQRAQDAILATLWVAEFNEPLPSERCALLGELETHSAFGVWLVKEPSGALLEVWHGGYMTPHMHAPEVIKFFEPFDM